MVGAKESSYINIQSKGIIIVKYVAIDQKKTIESKVGRFQWFLMLFPIAFMIFNYLISIVMLYLC